ncbi:hypothetical protein [Blattabacterium cuenoti]|nr:hypothetical protein [Blattabacterium cuenoti]
MIEFEGFFWLELLVFLFKEEMGINENMKLKNPSEKFYQRYFLEE